MSDFNELKIDGRVATPADQDWDEVRLAWNLAADLQPAAVAFVESAEDIAATVAFAAANDLRVSGQGTGHGAARSARPRGHDPDQDRGNARARGRPRGAGRPGSRPACSRSSSPRRPAPTASPACQAPHPTSA